MYKPLTAEIGTEPISDIEDNKIKNLSLRSIEIQVDIKAEIEVYNLKKYYFKLIKIFKSKAIGTDTKQLGDQCVDTNDNDEFKKNWNSSQMLNQSMETMNMSVWRGDCSRSVQTMFPDDNETVNTINKNDLNVNDINEISNNLSSKRRRFSKTKHEKHSFEDTTLHEIRLVN